MAETGNKEGMQIFWSMDMRPKGLTIEGFDRDKEELVSWDKLPAPLFKAGIGVMDHILLPAYQADDKDGKPIPLGQVRIIRLGTAINQSKVPQSIE